MGSDRSRRILAFDGGGVRGVLSVRMLERLIEVDPDLLAPIDLFAGTSTGAIVAAGLSIGMSASDLLAFYRDDAQRVFEDSIIDDIRDLGKLRGADYSCAPLRRLLVKQFGQTRLGDLKHRILIPAFDLDNESEIPDRRNWKPKFFHNMDADDPDCEELLADVVVRSCAAPVLFPSYQGYIDGGVAANNPSMAAIAQVLNSAKRIEVENIRLLSLASGHNPEYISGKRLDWGLTQWAPVFLRLLYASSMGVADYQCRQLLGDRYHRLSTVMEERIPSDAVAQIDHLIEIADSIDLSPTLAWIEREWRDA